MSANKSNSNLYTTDYGKNHVKLLCVKKERPQHCIKEVEVCTNLTLDNVRDYVNEDNTQMIPTDSQKNTVYVKAKQNGVAQIEEFALLLCAHFLRQYKQVATARISVEEYPWQRLEMNGSKHNHAFKMMGDCKRVCQVTQNRGETPVVTVGIKDLQIIKTTQSAYENFVSDEFQTLPYTKDRMWATSINANWSYNAYSGYNFDTVWETVKQTIVESFAGPADTGVNSMGVQNTLYKTGKAILAKIPLVETIELTMPVKHYFDYDFSRFPKLDFRGTENTGVFLAVDKPWGNIHAELRR